MALRGIVICSSCVQNSGHRDSWYLSRVQVPERALYGGKLDVEAFESLFSQSLHKDNEGQTVLHAASKNCQASEKALVTFIVVFPNILQLYD